MAEGLAAATANALLAAMLQGTSYAVSAQWVQLHVGAPGAAGTSNVAGNNVRADASTAFGTVPSGGSVANDDDIGTSEWASVSTSETYTHATVWTASSGGTFVVSGVLSVPAVTAGDAFALAPGDMTVDFPIAA